MNWNLANRACITRFIDILLSDLVILNCPIPLNINNLPCWFYLRLFWLILLNLLASQSNWLPKISTKLINEIRMRNFAMIHDKMTLGIRFKPRLRPSLFQFMFQILLGHHFSKSRIQYLLKISRLMPNRNFRVSNVISLALRGLVVHL